MGFPSMVSLIISWLAPGGVRPQGPFPSSLIILLPIHQYSSIKIDNYKFINIDLHKRQNNGTTEKKKTGTAEKQNKT